MMRRGLRAAARAAAPRAAAAAQLRGRCTPVPGGGGGAAAGMKPLPEEVDVVVIGGGIIGVNTAYWLGRRGKRVLIVEQNTLASGTTWHAAGLCAGFKGDEAMVEIARFSQQLYQEFVDEKGDSAVGWHKTGSLAIAASRDRWRALQRMLPACQRAGVPFEVLSPEGCVAAHPLLSQERCVGGVLLPGDGLIAPYDICAAIAKKARQQYGVQIAEHTRVTGFDVGKAAGNVMLRQVDAVHTHRGTVRCKQLALCTGMWSRMAGRMLGIPIPISSAPHQYMVSELMPGVSYQLPVVRDYDARIYVKPEVGGLVVGEFEGAENCPGPWSHHADDGTVPYDLPFELLEDNEDKIAEGMMLAMDLVPTLAETGVKRYVHGPDSSSADHGFILGPLPMYVNAVVGTGMNSQGIGSGGGVGLALSEWLLDGHPHSYKGDLTAHTIRRFHPTLLHDDVWARDRGIEGYNKLYTIHWPFEEMMTSRGRRKSALSDYFASRRGVMGAAGGMERVNWFAEESGPQEDVYSYDYKEMSWHAAATADSKATREGVAVFDMSSFAKVRVKGPDAAAELERLCTLKIDRPPEEANKLVYCCMCNERGGTEADLTVLREGPDSFYLVVGAVMGPHLVSHISTHLTEGANCVAEDISDETGVLAVMGPNSRDLLSAAMPGVSFATADFPFGTHQRHEVAGLDMRILRVSFVGELGWEIHCQMAELPALRQRVMDAAAATGIGARDAGYRAIHALRTERMFLHWGADISPLDTPLEVGWPIKKADFVGRSALVAQRKKGVSKRLVTLIAKDSDVSFFGHCAESLWRSDGGGEPRLIGTTTSGAFSYTLGRSVALAFVERNRVEDASATWEWILDEKAEYSVVVEGARHPVEIRRDAAFDPKGERMRA